MATCSPNEKENTTSHLPRPLRAYFTKVRQAADELLRGHTIADLVQSAPSPAALAFEI